MISIIVKECTHCGQLIDQCWYQQKLRSFGLDEICDAMSREISIPPLGEDETEWTSSSSPPTS